MIQEYEICLSIQRALLDKITSRLRRISFVKFDNLISLYFYYDGNPLHIDKELMEDTCAEVISDFPESYKINCEILNVKYPEKINSKGRIIFSRFE